MWNDTFTFENELDRWTSLCRFDTNSTRENRISFRLLRLWNYLASRVALIRFK